MKIIETTPEVMYMMRGAANPNVNQLLNSINNNAVQRIQTTNNRFIEQVNMLHQQVFNEDNINKAKLLLSQSHTSVTSDNIIYRVPEEQINNITGIMRDIIMYDPVIIDAYRNEDISAYKGFKDIYKDYKPNENPIAMRVNDGYFSSTDDIEPTIYFDSFDHIPEIELYDAMTIRETWETVRELMYDDMFDPE